MEQQQRMTKRPLAINDFIDYHATSLVKVLLGKLDTSFFIHEGLLVERSCYFQKCIAQSLAIQQYRLEDSPSPA